VSPIFGVCVSIRRGLNIQFIICITVFFSFHKTVIIPVVLDGCETWSITIRKEHRLRVFENRLLRRIFVPKREEIAGGWREVRNKEALYSSLNIVSTHGRHKNCIQNFCPKT